MGGISSDSGEKLNIELNLVPFIDLLSSLVLFLLITTVWVQISAIPAGIDTKGSANLVVNKNSELATVRLSDRGYDFLWPPSLGDASKLPLHMDKDQGKFDLKRLTLLFNAIVKSGRKATAAVSADDAVEYGDVIRAIDTVKETGLESVALSSN